ncbi:MAG: hypothetical protein IJU68_06030 [Bacteroidales bacterium]|nr:hypothetical protein [Bacteroidales bacterium]
MKKPICFFILLFLCITSSAHYYSHRTTGNVKDASNNPIVGAVIKEDGVPLNSTITDIDGIIYLMLVMSIVFLYARV